MCGRYTLSSPSDLLRDLFELEEAVELGDRYNIAPSQEAAVGTDDGDGPRLTLMRWGLVPFWAKDPGIGHRMINARSETVREKPSFRTAFRRRRCLVAATGFYEWQKTDGRKQPWFFGLEGGGPFAMAGLWDRWDKGDTPLESFTILTTEPNELVAQAHHRMPVILERGSYGAWLDTSLEDTDQLVPLLAPFNAGEMKGYPVSTFVNSPANDSPLCVEPLPS